MEFRGLFLLAELVVAQEADLFFVGEGSEVSFTKMQPFAGAEDVVIDGAGGVPRIGRQSVSIRGD